MKLAIDERPRTLKEVRGQEHIVKYFSSVVKRPDEAIKNYILIGPRGCGKTTISRAFVNDLNGDLDSVNSTNYLELDSFQFKTRSSLSMIRDYIFQSTPGRKVVVFDEAHMIETEVQNGLLKDIEDSTEIFFFFLSTEKEGIIDPIFSRSIYFQLQKLSREKLSEYMNVLLTKYEFNASDRSKEIILLRSDGHVRDAVNQIQMLIFEGEENFVSSYIDSMSLLTEFFTSKDKSVVESLVAVPFSYLSKDLEYFILHRIIRGKEIFVESEIPKMFAFYLKIKQYIKTENDFYSFLYVMFEFIAGLKRK